MTSATLSEPVPARDPARPFLWIALLAAGAALLLRLYGLDLRSISHPEIFVPGIPLIEGHSAPPRRDSLSEVLWMHFHDEPHPMGWYWAMFGWTSLFGTSLWTLRLPSAILGAVSVLAICGLGRRVYGPAAGALAAVLLALHGFHVFWSQGARMYVTGGLLAILATILIVRLTHAASRPRWLAPAYVAALAAGVMTVETFWPLVGIHLLWAALMLPAAGRFSWRALVSGRFAGAHPAVQLQALAIILGAPELLHGVYRARGGAASDPSLEFAGEYLGFGFLYAKSTSAEPVLTIGAAPMAALVALALCLLAAALRARGGNPHPAAPGRDVAPWLPLPLALLSSALMVWLASIALHRNGPLLAVATLPVLTLALPALSLAVRGVVERSGALAGRLARTDGPVVLVWMLAVAAPVVIFAGSFVVSLLADRAFLVFVPFLLVLVAAGAAGLTGRLGLRPVLIALLVAVFGASIPYFWRHPGSPRDYKALAALMAPELRQGDLVLVRHRDWTDTPFFYHLPGAGYVFADHDAALARHPGARVWLVTWPNPGEQVVNDARRDALAGYRRVGQVTALRASAELFVPR